MPDFKTTPTLNSKSIAATEIHAATDTATPAAGDEWGRLNSAGGVWTWLKLTTTEMLAWLGSLFAVLAGTAGGQTLNGGNAANDDLTLRATAHATKTSANIILNDTGGKVVIGSATPGGGLFNIRGVPASTYGFETETDSAGRGFQVVTTDYVNGSVGSTLTMQLANGTGDVAAYLNAFTVGKTAAAVLALQHLSGGKVAIGLASVNASVLGIIAGTSSNDAAVGGVLYVDSGTHNNSSTTETTLATYTVPANTLSANNMSLEIEAWGTFTNAAASKTLKLYFGATAVTFVPGSGGTAGQWSVHARVIRTGAATQDVLVEAIGTAVTPITITTAAETLSGTVVAKVTGQGGASSQITQQGFLLRWADANT